MNINNPVNQCVDLIKIHWSLLLILSTAFLFATKNSYNVPMSIMAVTGLYRLIKHRELRAMPEIRFIHILFFSLWLPMLFSLTDAVNLPHSLEATLRYLGYLFVAYFIVYETKNKHLHNKIILGLGIIISFWCLDALLQFFVGMNLLGYPLNNGLVDGLFSPKGTLGHVLAILSPIYFEIIRRYHARHRYLWLLLLILFCVVLLGGKRAAWIMLLSSCGIYSIYLFYLYRLSALKIFLVGIPVVILTLGLLVTQYHPLNTRVNDTLGLFSEDYEQINQSTSMRLPIWQTGIKIYVDHQINGIGPRGFRYAYASYADADDFFLVDGRSGTTHPHLTLLEILVETGSLGLLGYLIFWLYLMRLIFQLTRENRAYHLPWLFSIVVAVLPYNAGSAFYASYWSSIIWLIIPLAACFIFSSENKTS